MAGRRFTITVVDEGYYRKTYNVPENQTLNKVIDRYCRELCKACTKSEHLDFWHEATKVFEDVQDCRERD